MVQQQNQQRQSLELSQRQQQDQYNLQVLQSNNQIANQYNQQRQQVEQERAAIMAKHKADRVAHQREGRARSKLSTTTKRPTGSINKSNPRSRKQGRRPPLLNKRLSKSIGSKGAILSAGRTGQSVGLLINDAERQSGFAQAQADAQLASTMEQSQISMDQAFLQSQGANNQAMSRVGMFPENPYMPSFPGIPNFVDPYTDSSDEPAFGAA